MNTFRNITWRKFGANINKTFYFYDFDIVWSAVPSKCCQLTSSHPVVIRGKRQQLQVKTFRYTGKAKPLTQYLNKSQLTYEHISRQTNGWMEWRRHHTLSILGMPEYIIRATVYFSLTLFIYKVWDVSLDWLVRKLCSCVTEIWITGETSRQNIPSPEYWM